MGFPKIDTYFWYFFNATIAAALVAVGLVMTAVIAVRSIRRKSSIALSWAAVAVFALSLCLCIASAVDKWGSLYPYWTIPGDFVETETEVMNGTYGSFFLNGVEYVDVDGVILKSWAGDYWDEAVCMYKPDGILNRNSRKTYFRVENSHGIEMLGNKSTLYVPADKLSYINEYYLDSNNYYFAVRGKIISGDLVKLPKDVTAALKDYLADKKEPVDDIMVVTGELDEINLEAYSYDEIVRIFAPTVKLVMYEGEVYYKRGGVVTGYGYHEYYIMPLPDELSNALYGYFDLEEK